MDLKIGQLDITATFVNAPLSEVIIMKLPPGFVAAEGNVLRLWKVIYGMKYANEEWHKLLCTYLMDSNTLF